MSFFEKVIYYKCSFFFNVADLEKKMKSELTFVFLNKNFSSVSFAFFVTSRIFQTIFCKIFLIIICHMFLV